MAYRHDDQADNKVDADGPSLYCLYFIEERLDSHPVFFQRLGGSSWQQCFSQLDHHAVATEFLNLPELHGISAWWSSWQQSWCWWSILVLSLFNCRKPGLSSSLLSRAWRMIFDCAEASSATRSARGVTSELLGFHRSRRRLQDHRKTSSCDSC